MNLPTRALALPVLLSAAPLAAQELRHVGFRGFWGAVYDPVRERVIVPDIGGYSHEWDGNSWYQVPDAGSRAGFCYREASDGRLVTVVETGWGTGPVFVFHERIGHEWQPKSAAGGPADRWGMAIAYDKQRGELVAFGGQDGLTGLPMAETWTFDGTNWTQHNPPAPSPRFMGSAGYDSVRQRVVLFGGYLAAAMADTWEWDGTNWTQVTTANVPPGRTYASMCFDSARGVLVMAGGVGNSASLVDMWEYDGLNWLPQPSPAATLGGSLGNLVYDEARAESLLLGISTTTTLVGVVQSWDGAQWSVRPGFGIQPYLASFSASSVDHTGTYVLRHGGWYGGAGWSGQDLVGWDGSNWTVLVTGGPSSRSAAVMWPMTNATYLFGGAASGGPVLGDLWRWNGANWAQLSPAVSPPARMDAAAAYHPTVGHGLMFGGSATGTQYGALGDTWKFDGTNWQQLTNGPQPGARRYAAMAYDPVRDRIVMCGGENLSPFPGGGTIYDDTWEHDGTSWTQVLASNGPVVNFTSRFSVAFDANRQRMVAVIEEGGGYLLWEYDGTSWTQFSVAGDAHSTNRLAAYQPLACTGPNGALVVTDVYGVMELLPDPSSAESYGTACTAAAPNLLANELPDLGQSSFRLEVTLAPANGIVVIAGAHQSTNVSVLGCTLLVQPLTTALLVADAQGFAAQPLPLPNNAALLGSDYFFQAAVLDSTVPNGISLSRGLRITLGE